MASFRLPLVATLWSASAEALPTLRLRNGVEMPVIALGTGGYDNETAGAAFATAFKAGLNHVHTAYDYYNLPGVGQVLRGLNRSEVFVSGMTSPCKHTAGPPVRNVTDPRECYALTKSEVDEMLSSLGLEYVDLLMLHGPSEPFGYQDGCDADICELNQAQWRAYQDALSAGKARAIGVSNYCQSCLTCLMKHPTTTTLPAVNQFQLHVGMGENPEQLPAFCVENGIVVQAYSPLAAGGVIQNEACAEIGGELNRSAAQVGLRWVLQQKQKPALVVKASKLEYIQEDLDIFSWSLSSAQIKKLSAETSPKGQQDGRPCWGCSK